VFLHGNPTSSYLWRNIIPHVVENGRCVAPDLVGFGRSGPATGGRHLWRDHQEYVDAWFEAMNLNDVTLVLHDWGSVLGFSWARRNNSRVRAIAYMEALMQPRLWTDFPNGRDQIFRALRSEKGVQMVTEQNFFVETVLPKSVIRSLSAEEMEQYRRPFATREARLRTLDFARELPIEGYPADVAAEVERYGAWLSSSEVPKLLINANPGALLTGRSLEFSRKFPNQTEITVPGIHYLQEDSPKEIGEALREFLLRT
jgi:haloalkane dehalogenase